MNKEDLIRKHIYFSGRVQGVGFRYQAMYLANALGLTGTVANLWDGRVEMEVQGREPEIGKLLGSLDGRGFIQIDHMEIVDMPIKETDTGFRVLN